MSCRPVALLYLNWRNVLSAEDKKDIRNLIRQELPKMIEEGEIVDLIRKYLGGAVLSDGTIQEMLDRGELITTTLTKAPNPAWVDLKSGTELKVIRRERAGTIDTRAAFPEEILEKIQL